MLAKPTESQRILRNRFVIIGIYRHLIFTKVSNSRLPQQAEAKNQGGAAVRRPQGVFNYGGVRVQIPAENSGRDRRQGPGALECHLARRPRWGGGALRAFRRAEFISKPYRLIVGLLVPMA